MNLTNKIHTNLRRALLPLALAMSPPFSSCQTYITRQEYPQKTENSADSEQQSKISISINSLPLNIKLDSTLTNEEKSYFPLVEGNTWTYQRTFNDNVFSCKCHIFESDNETVKYLIINQLNSSTKEQKSSLDTVETYTVVKKTEEGFWEVRIEGEDSRDEKYLKIRDKENKNVKYVKWGYGKEGVREVRNGRIPKFEQQRRYVFDSFDRGEKILLRIENRELNDNKTIENSWPYLGLLRQGAKESYPLGRIIVEFQKIMQPIPLTKPPIEIERLNEYNAAEIRSLLHKGTITVPAGTFTDCIKSVMMVNGKNLEEVMMNDATPEYAPWFVGFITESYLAKGVGLVKEVQYNKEEKETYRLELKSYTIK